MESTPAGIFGFAVVIEGPWVAAHEVEVDRVGSRRQLLCRSVTDSSAEIGRLSGQLGCEFADVVVADLAGHLEGRKDEPAHTLLVADKDGEPIPQNRFSQTWARAVRRVGMPPGTRFHDLRHTYANALIASGCSVKVVQAYLGHESEATTLGIYSHLWRQDDDRARAAVQAFFAGDVSPVCHDEATG